MLAAMGQTWSRGARAAIARLMAQQDDGELATSLRGANSGAESPKPCPPLSRETGRREGIARPARCNQQAKRGPHRIQP